MNLLLFIRFAWVNWTDLEDYISDWPLSPSLNHLLTNRPLGETSGQQISGFDPKWRQVSPVVFVGEDFKQPEGKPTFSFLCRTYLPICLGWRTSAAVVSRHQLPPPAKFKPVARQQIVQHSPVFFPLLSKSTANLSALKGTCPHSIPPPA